MDHLELEVTPDGADLLQQTPLFRHLSYEETLALATLVRRESYPAGAAIVEQGSLGNALYLVQKGTVRVERILESPDQPPVTRVLGSLEKGQLFGEMSLVDDLLTSARCVAETETEVLVIDRGPFEKLMSANDCLALKIYKAFCRLLSERLRTANDRLADAAGLVTQIT